jgi:hypothetical protein
MGVVVPVRHETAFGRRGSRFKTGGCRWIVRGRREFCRDLSRTVAVYHRTAPRFELGSSSGISDARSQMMMLGNVLGWMTWYGKCTKRAIMRPVTSASALMLDFERVTPTPRRATSR